MKETNKTDTLSAENTGLSDTNVKTKSEKEIDTSKIRDRDILIRPNTSILIICGISILMAIFLGILQKANPIYIITGAIIFPILTYCAIIDYKKHLVANICCVLIGAIGFIPFIYNLVCGNYYSLLDAALGAALIPLPLFIAAMITNGGFGGGDIKIMIGVGFCVGLFKGFTILILALFLSVIFMLISNTVKKCKAKKTNASSEKIKNVAFPFVQYIAIAVILLFFANI